MMKIEITRTRRRRKKSIKGWLGEFSKRLIFTLTILFICERIFSMVVIWMNDGTGIDVFLQTGAEVFLASVVAYALKAGFENVFKIKQSKED